MCFGHFNGSVLMLTHVVSPIALGRQSSLLVRRLGFLEQMDCASEYRSRQESKARNCGTSGHSLSGYEVSKVDAVTSEAHVPVSRRPYRTMWLGSEQNATVWTGCVHISGRACANPLLFQEGSSAAGRNWVCRLVCLRRFSWCRSECCSWRSSAAFSLN